MLEMSYNGVCQFSKTQVCTQNQKLRTSFDFKYLVSG